MSVTRLKIEQFRNLRAPDLALHARCNLFHGDNGSGKTSLLEAMHYLCLARSFRSNQASRIILHNASHFTLFGQFAVPGSTHLIPAGIEKHRSGETKIKIDGAPIRSTAELARLHPLQVINASTFHLLDAGPQHRREFLDWGVFHVEPTFFQIWKRLQIALKQRNAALRQRIHPTQIKLWDKEFITASYALDALRVSYIRSFLPLFESVLKQLLDLKEITLHYQSGWDAKLPLETVLERNFERDNSLGYTQYGPQRADLALRIRHQPLDEILSRGEQKLVTYTLRHVQGLLLHQLTQKQCIYLLDDLAAELDEDNRNAILALLQHAPFQVFITVLEPKHLENFIKNREMNMFHVEQGVITPSNKPS
ncbi:MAG: DNA replication/repair protein RecF [Gammaproteobacteria bacterium]